jgi:hypothetical protein
MVQSCSIVKFLCTVLFNLLQGIVRLTARHCVNHRTLIYNILHDTTWSTAYYFTVMSESSSRYSAVYNTILRGQLHDTIGPSTRYCMIYGTVLYWHDKVWYTVQYCSEYGTSNVWLSCAAYYQTVSFYARYCIVRCKITVWLTEQNV